MKHTPPTTESKVVKVVHVDDDAIFLQCVKNYVEQSAGIKVVAQYGNATQLLKSLTLHEPFDVLIIDYILPEMNGSELLTQLRSRHIKVPVVSFTSHSFPEYAQQLQKDGIVHTLAKNQLKYLAALLQKCAGDTYPKKQNKLLTPNDMELLMLCCNNYSREQMADKLCIGMDAVKIRKKQLSHKLGVSNDNIELLKWAIRNGYYEA